MESEISLPKNTIKQIIQKKLSPSLKSSANGVSQLVADLTLDFITILSEKAYEQCLASGKKTLMPDHVISAMRSSNIPMNPEEITSFLADLDKIKAVTII
jgi:Class 2 transcription repressor NC2, beta subunit (Dr1)